jgi:hypothetical protein
MTSLYFEHDHHVLQYKTLPNVTYLDESHAMFLILDSNFAILYLRQVY